MMIGLYIAISRGNLVKKIMGINIFQASVILLYVSMGKVAGARPILVEDGRRATSSTRTRSRTC